MIDRRTVMLGAGAAGMAAALDARAAPADPTETIDLWPGRAPGFPASPPVELIEERSKTAGVRDRSMRHIARPRLVVFRPARPNGLAALVAPGGGYSLVVIDKEGYELGQSLSAEGWTVFVLFYRLPGDGWAAGPDVALSDAQRAMRLIRARAGDYGIRPDRIAAIGFSAGGHVCGDLATRHATTTYAAIDAADRLSARPDLAAPIYAVQSMTLPMAHGGSRTQLLGANPSAAIERAHSTAANVSAATPPCFLVHAEDDKVVDVENSLEFRAACKRAGVPVDLHLFASCGHVVGLRGVAGKPAAAWPDLFVRWAEANWR